MKHVFWAFVLFMFSNCASKTASTTAQENLERRFEPQIGSATKADFVEHFGNAEWCRMQEIGGETCRFYRKKGTKWIGDSKMDKKSHEQYDQVIADFDGNGKLRQMKADSQR